MRPSPFTGKFKRKEIKPNDQDKNQPKVEQPSQQFQISNDNHALKPPTANKHLIKVGKSKERDGSREKEQDSKKIYDALKEDDEVEKVESKASANFKPNLKLLKGGKKIKLSTHQNPTPNPQPQAQPQQSYRPIPKPTLFKKPQPQPPSDRRQQNQQPLIEQQNNKNPPEQDSQQNSQSMSIAPKFKIKNKQDITNFPVIHEQVYEGPGSGGVNNFGDLRIETREIRLDGADGGGVSMVKVEKQQARVRDLGKLLNLEEDLYEEMLNISCVTSYEIYINKIKSGSLTNSGDQAFDQKSTRSTQTHEVQQCQFTNQCPQDYHTDITSISMGVEDKTQNFNRFIGKIAPILEELIKPSTTVVMPPIFLLALRPQFRIFVTCPFPLFVYHSDSLNVGIVVVGEKLYIAEGQISCVTAVGGGFVGGGNSGQIWVWAGANDRRSRLYRRVLEQTQTTNFQLPEATNYELDRFSIYRSHHAIKSILTLTPDSFMSLDQSCKLTKWQLIRTPSASATSTPLKLQPLNSFELSSILQRPNLIGYDIKRRNQMFFINSSAGILVWNGQEILQKLDVEGLRVLGFALPFRTGFVYAVCEDSTLRIYDEHYANQLYKMHMPGTSLCDIHIPETQYQNKKLSQTSQLYLITSTSEIYSLNLLNSPSSPTLITRPIASKQRDIIFRGVNRLADSFEIVCLWRDLKCTSQVRKMDTNVQPTVANIKNILQANRQMHDLLEGVYSVLLLQ